MRTVMKCILMLGMSLGVVGCAPGEKTPSAEMQQASEAKIRSDIPLDEKRASMMSVLALSGPVADRVGGAFDARDQAVEAFLKGEEGQRLIALEAEMASAARDKDLAGVRRATEQAGPLRDALRNIVKEGEQAILETLTPSQRIQWQGYEVSSRLLSTMEPLGLDGRQTDAIVQAGPEAVAQAIDQGEVNPSAAAFMALEQWAETEVLGADQRTRYVDVKAQKGLRSLGI